VTVAGQGVLATVGNDWTSADLAPATRQVQAFMRVKTAQRLPMA
jgi:hypothetical protein